jgi:hypothetical protein
MRTDCPHCGKRIRWWNYLGSRPASGERRFLPNRAITVCPFCRGDLAPNNHPFEKRLNLLVFTPFGVVLILFFNLPDLQIVWIAMLGFLLLVMIIALGYMHLKTRNWQRFRRYEGEP